MDVIRLFKTAQSEANFLVASSLVVLLLKTIVLNRCPAFFDGAYELGLIVEAILASVVASYVFYLFVVHLKEGSDKATIHPYIARHVARVVGDCQSQLRAIARFSVANLSLANVSLTSITDAFKNIAPFSDAPLIIGPHHAHANWFQYFSYHGIRTHESVGRVLAQILYIDAQLVSLITAVDECSHFDVLNLVQNMEVANQDLSAWALTFFHYCELCRKLDEYRERHYKSPIND